MTNRFLDLFNPGGSVPDAFAAMQREFDRMMGERRPGWPMSDGFDPALDVRQTDGGVEISAELPGMAAEDVTVEIRDDMLSIRGEKKSESESTDDKTGAIHKERRYGVFQRSVRLPFRADADTATARFDKGVLKLAVPAAGDQTDAPRRIPIG